jgi:hypothetical protein
MLVLPKLQKAINIVNGELVICCPMDNISEYYMLPRLHSDYARVDH